jgi:hypothetical protein
MFGRYKRHGGEGIGDMKAMRRMVGRPVRQEVEGGDFYAIKRRPARHDAEVGDLNAMKIEGGDLNAIKR